MTVFEAFPNAVELWGIGATKFSTITGNVTDFANGTQIHVIVDRGDSTDPNPIPTAQGISSDTLVYCKPSELPTTDVAELCASYVVGPWTGNKVFAIIDASLGKNQDSGIIEHIELKVRQTETQPKWPQS